MVLEEATSSQEPAIFSEALPSSDIDPYSSSTTDTLSTRSSSLLRLEQSGPDGQPQYVNLNNLPRPFSVFEWQASNEARARAIRSVCTYANHVLQRPLKQEEADAFAFHFAKGARVASFGSPIGISIAWLWAGSPKAMKDFRFPIWRPMKEGTRYSPDRLGPLRGAQARMGWHFLRFSAYGFIGSILGSLFFASYGVTLHAAGRATDPRLEEYMQVAKSKDHRLQAARAMRESSAAAPGRAEGESFDMAKQRRSVQQQQEAWKGRQSGKKKANDDDMSPTSGAFAEEFMSAGSDSGLMSDAQTSAQQNRVEEASTALDMSASIYEAQSRSSVQSTSAQQSRQQPTKTSGSSWERLRQGAMSEDTNSASTPRSQKLGAFQPRRSFQSRSESKAEDNFGYSQSDENRQLARSEAQKDFDARIERERQGQNFEENGRENDR